MRNATIILLIVLLAACSLRDTPPATSITTTPTPEPTPSTTPEPPTTPARSTTSPPPGASTTSGEPIGSTSDCTVSADCVTYKEKDGTPGELCAHYDDTGCYHHYDCTPSGEVMQKETPAFCGRS